jgi:hypothetical protein
MLAPDVDGDFRVGGDDLAIWANAYGSSGALVAANSAVPEPAGIILVVLALASMGCRRWSR